MWVSWVPCPGSHRAAIQVSAKAGAHLSLRSCAKLLCQNSSLAAVVLVLTCFFQASRKLLSLQDPPLKGSPRIGPPWIKPKSIY